MSEYALGPSSRGLFAGQVGPLVAAELDAEVLADTARAGNGRALAAPVEVVGIRVDVVGGGVAHDEEILLLEKRLGGHRRGNRGEQEYEQDRDRVFHRARLRERGRRHPLDPRLSS